MQTSPNFARHLPKLLMGLLTAGTLVRCECEADQFYPAATLTPDTVLQFGEVSVASEKTLTIEVRSNGSAAYKITDGSVQLSNNARTQWKVDPDPRLLTGLTPGKTTTISVTYRPCPEAWDGNTIKASFDFDGCPTSVDASDLTFADNSRDGTQRIGLSGQPVAPPNISIWCPMGNTGCNNATPQLVECNGANFGTVNSGDPPCDIIFEVRNTAEAGKPTGELSIDNAEILVQDFSGPIFRGPDAGFEVLDEAGSPLVIDSATPLVVPIDPLTMGGKKRFKLRFKGSRTGLWRGEAMKMTGLRLYNTDPQKPIATAPLTAIGSAPHIDVNPDFIDFGPVPQGTTKTATITIGNSGDAVLRIDEIKLEGTNPEIVLRTSRGTLTNIMVNGGESFFLYVSYTPQNNGTDVEKIIIASNDPDVPRYEVPIRGGAVPAIRLEPGDVVPFLNGLPAPRRERVTIYNVGYGELIISRLRITGPSDMTHPDGDDSHPSVDDFTIIDPAGCGVLCDPDIHLCAPNLPGCTMSSKVVVIEYANNDISTSDNVVLYVYSNDPAQPIATVVLSATDSPCFPPTGVITVTTPRPCAGQPININATSSSPGGPPGMPSTIVSYDWSFLFFQPPEPSFSVNHGPNAMSSFTPTRGGVYFLGLSVSNACGGTSPSATTEMINVADLCN